MPNVRISHFTEVNAVLRKPGDVVAVTDALANRLIGAGLAKAATGSTPSPLLPDPLPQYGMRSDLLAVRDRVAANALLVVGNSYTDAVGAQGTGFAGIASAILGAPPTLVSGHGGYRVDQLVGIVDGLLPNLPAGTRLSAVVVEGGGNDALQNTPIATTKAAYISVAAKIQAYGAVPVFTTVPAAFTEAEAARARPITAWLLDNAARYGWLVVDLSGLIDPATNRMAATYRFDDTHVNAFGHALIAAAVARVLRPLFPVNRGWLPIASGAAPGSKFLTNQCFTGTVTSGMPNGWATVNGVVSANAVHSVIDPVAGQHDGWLGKVFRIHIPAGGSGHAVKRWTGASSITAGRRYRLVMRARIAATNVSAGGGPSFQIRWDNGQVSYLFGTLLHTASDFVVSQDVTAPAGATGADVTLYLDPRAGALTLDVGQVDLIDTTVRDAV